MIVTAKANIDGSYFMILYYIILYLYPSMLKEKDIHYKYLHRLPLPSGSLT